MIKLIGSVILWFLTIFSISGSNINSLNNRENCNNRNNKFNVNDLCDYLLVQIGEYLNDPVASLGSLNQRFFQIFHGDFSLKHFINQRFNISHF